MRHGAVGWTVAVCGAMLVAGAAGCARQRAEPAEPLTVIETSTLREDAMLMLTEFTTSDQAELRTNSVEALSGIPARVEPAVASGLKDPNEAVRFASAMVAGYDRLEGLAGSVRTLLDDPSPSVRAAAIFALIRCGEPVDRTPLAPILLSNPSPGHRANAAFVLGELGDPSALALLRTAVTDPMRSFTEADARLLRLQIAEAMIKLGDDSQLEAVRAALYPSRPEELEATALAVQVIGEVGDQVGMDQLIYLTAYREEGQMMPAEVRLAAAASLAKLGRPQGSPIAMEYVEDERAVIRAQSAYVLGQTGRAENLRTLREMMGDESEIVRLTAAAAVLDITSGRAAGASAASR